MIRESDRRVRVIDGDRGIRAGGDGAIGIAQEDAEGFGGLLVVVVEEVDRDGLGAVVAVRPSHGAGTGSEVGAQGGADRVRLSNGPVDGNFTIRRTKTAEGEELRRVVFDGGDAGRLKADRSDL